MPIKDGWKHESKLFIIAIILDCIDQVTVFHPFYPVETLIIAFALASVPYSLLRGPVNPGQGGDNSSRLPLPLTVDIFFTVSPWA